MLLFLAGKLLVYTPTSVRTPAKLVAKLNILSIATVIFLQNHIRANRKYTNNYKSDN